MPQRAGSGASVALAAAVVEPSDDGRLSEAGQGRFH